MKLNLFRETVGESSKPAHGHTHGQVLAFDIAGGDVLAFGFSAHYFFAASDALRWAVALLSFGSLAINLDELRIINMPVKRFFDCCQINAQAVAG